MLQNVQEKSALDLTLVGFYSQGYNFSENFIEKNRNIAQITEIELV